MVQYSRNVAVAKQQTRRPHYRLRIRNGRSGRMQATILFFLPMSRSTFRVMVRLCFGNGDARPLQAFKSSFPNVLSLNLYGRHTITNNAGKKRAADKTNKRM